MFHLPAHRAASAAQFAVNVNAKVDCPRCGGTGDHGYDESGAPYACYYCGTSGFVSLGVAFADYAANAKYNYEAEVANREWVASCEGRRAEANARIAVAYDDDIPF